VATGIVSIPNRYMHSPNQIVSDRVDGGCRTGGRADRELHSRARNGHELHSDLTRLASGGVTADASRSQRAQPRRRRLSQGGVQAAAQCVAGLDDGAGREAGTIGRVRDQHGQEPG
jgi:hypothetical protein